MKKFLYTLTAIAVLTSSNFLAQDVASFDNSSESNLGNQCYYSVSQPDKTLKLNGTTATQTFSACTDGKLSEIALDVKGMNDRGTYSLEIRSMTGELLDFSSFKHGDLNAGKVTLQMKTRVKAGARYILSLKSEVGYDLSLRVKEGPMGSLTVDGAPYRGKLAGKFTFKNVATAVISDNGRSTLGNNNGLVIPTEKSANGLCNTELYNFDGRVATTGETLIQSFTACSNGTLDKVTMQIQHIDADFMGRIFVRNEAGATLFLQEITPRNLRNGVLEIPMHEKVTNGDVYYIGIKSLHNTRLAVYANSNPTQSLGKLTFNGTNLTSNLCFGALIKKTNLATLESIAEPTIKVTAFPNPFENSLGVRVEGVHEGKVIVQLIDFTGTIVRADILNIDPNSINPDNKVLSFNTEDVKDLGFYSLRVVNGDKVTHTTVIKH